MSNRNSMPLPKKEEAQSNDEQYFKEDAKNAAKKDIPNGPPMAVVATMKGIYKQMRKEEGDKFTIDGPHHFSKVWMKKI